MKVGIIMDNSIVNKIVELDKKIRSIVNKVV